MIAYSSKLENSQGVEYCFNKNYDYKCNLTLKICETLQYCMHAIVIWESHMLQPAQPG